MSGDYLCSVCLIKPATCFGSYEGLPPNFACDDCCGHGCEDGSCVPIPLYEEDKAANGWIAFSDRRPEPQYDRDREGPSHPDILVTNNLAARNRWGQMSHLWLVHMVHYHDHGPYEFGGQVLAEKGEITAFAHPGNMALRGLTHWRPAVPEEWPA